MEHAEDGEHDAPDGASTGSPSRGRLIRAIIFLAAVVALVVLSRFLNLREVLESFLDWIGAHKGLGSGAFVLLYIVATVLALPGSILTLGGGAIFGLGLGFVLVSAGSTLGATAAFLVGRYLAREWVAKRVRNSARFKAVDDAVAQEGWKIVFLTRLSPIIPFNLQNYAYGLTKVDVWHYMLASWVGMMPGTLMYVYLGSAVGSLAQVLAGERQRSPLEYVLFGLGLIATVVVTVYVTRLARRRLRQEAALDSTAAESN